MSGIHTHSHPARVGFFTVGEVLIHVEHPSGTPQEDILAWIDNLWSTYGLTSNSNYGYSTQGMTITSLGTEGQIASLLKLPITALAEAEADEIPELVDKDTQLIGLINTLNTTNRMPHVMGTFVFKAATLNWVFSALNHSVGHPSPGGRPKPVPDGDIPSPAANQVDQATRDVITDAVARNPVLSPAPSIRKPSKIKRASTACSVNVVILDTAPPQSESELEELCNPETGHFSKQHRLWDMLHNNQLHILHAVDHGITLPLNPDEDHRSFAIKTGDKVSDHGLFIAGIVHSIAPEANIYLVEVLNQYGIGTIESIVQGVQLFTENRDIIESAAIPVIVNCSFSIGFLDVDELQHELEHQGLPPLHFDDTDPQTMQEVDMLRTALRRFGEVFSQARIFAAAGNDAPDVQPPDPPQAYIPAAFDFIQGIGATKSNDERAWYSNLSDLPPLDGVLVYGGGMIQGGAGINETDPDDAMRSIYVGEFPDGSANTNGWAYWSGTSFATGRMSGMFANAATRCRNISPNAPHDLYKDFKKQAVDTDPPSAEKALPGK